MQFTAMSLGPPGASLDPEQAENFEDVSLSSPLYIASTDRSRWKSNSLSKVCAMISAPYLCTLLSPAAVQQMTTYWAILEKVRGSSLRLTKMDDEIIEHLRKDFPDFDAKETIDEDKMKSKEGKERWRNFVNQYDKKIDDFNFGTILRTNPKFEYGEKETIFAVRMQFYAIEIARNRAGLNDWVYEQSHPNESVNE